MLRTTDLAAGRLRDAVGGIFVPEPVPSTHRLVVGDILVSRAGTIGRAFLVPPEAVDLTFAGFLVRLRPRPDVDPRFLAYALSSTQVQDQVQAGAIVSTIQNFNAERYEQLLIPNLSSHEQVEVSNLLDSHSSTHRSLIEQIDQSITFLQERKQALITAAVTGPLDVTTARSGLGVDVP